MRLSGDNRPGKSVFIRFPFILILRIFCSLQKQKLKKVSLLLYQIGFGKNFKSKIKSIQSKTKK